MDRPLASAGALRELEIVLATGAVGLLLAGLVAFTPWYPRDADAVVVEVATQVPATAGSGGGDPSVGLEIGVLSHRDLGLLPSGMYVRLQWRHNAPTYAR